MKQEKYISNSFTVAFSKQEKIRRQANAFEDTLIETCPSVQILPIIDCLVDYSISISKKGTPAYKLKKFLGTWQGNDNQAMLNLVYSTRSEF